MFAGGGEIERFRNGKSIFTPPRELQVAIADVIRATGKLDDFEVTALVHAGVMKKVHLRHPRYREEAACGPYPTLLTDDRELRDVRKVPPQTRPCRRRDGVSVEGRIRLTPTGSPEGLRPPSWFQRYCATAPRSAVAPDE